MRILTALIFFILSFQLRSQTISTFTLLSVNEGLSQGMVYDILQSRDGFLWMATKDGLNRYDGYRFEIFSPDPFDPFTIAANEVYHLFEDSRGWIWGKLPGRIDIYDPRSGRFFHLPKQPAPGFSEMAYQFSFAETPDGTVWLSDEGRLWKIEVPPDVLEEAAKAGNAFPELPCKAVEVPPVAGFPDRAIKFRSLIFTQKKGLLASSNEGLFRFDLASGQLRPEAFQGFPVQVLGEDKSGQVWIEVGQSGSGEVSDIKDGQLSSLAEPGLWVWENDSAAPSRMGSSRPFYQCRFDHNGNMWTVHEKKLRKWRPEVFAKGGEPEFEWASTDPVFQNPILTYQCFFFDRSGIVWVGTSGFGVFKINPEKPKFSSYLPGVSQRILVEDLQGNLISMINPGEIYPAKNFDRPKPNPWFSKLPEKWQEFLPIFDKVGNAWGIPEADVLLRIDAQTKAVRQYEWKGAGRSLPMFCKNGTLLQVSEKGLSQFDPVSGQSRDYPFGQLQKLAPEARFFQNLYEDSEGKVWIFGFEGLIKAVPTGGTYHYEYFKTDPSNPSSLSYNTVLSVAEDPLEPKRYLWAGTKGGGLNRLDRQTGQFKHYKKEQGLPDNVVYGILSDNSGHIWLSTNKGLCRFHVRDETVKIFTYADGLQDNEFNSSSYLKMKDGTLVFGGVRGLTIFHPDSLRFNENMPQTRIVGLKINNQPVSDLGFRISEGASDKSEIRNPKSQIVLSHRQNLITLEFAALEFSNPAQNHYRYQLVRKSALQNGDDNSWVDLGSKNSVQFANLSPGSYTFRVLGSNNDGIWGEVPDELHFVIRPPWWATWWAYLLYALILGSLIWLFYGYRLRQRLEHQETLRLQELDEFKNRFFTNITHEFRTPLTVILGNLEMEKLEVGKLRNLEIEKLSGNKISQFLNFLISKNTITRRNAESLLRLINQVLDLAKLESNTLKINYVQGDVLPYLRYIAESLHSLANAQNVMLRVESGQPEIVMDYDPERLLQIVYNLLSNAIKFTPSSGKVVLRAGLLNFQSLVNLKLTVSDTGAGIPKADLPFIFDRFHQANNLEKAKAGGTGIGLALTKELVLAMQGEISVESELGKGTTFTVQLPITNKAESLKANDLPPKVAETPSMLQQAPPSAAHRPSSTVHPLPSTVHRPPSTVNLLIIEDNPDVVEYLADCLKDSYAIDFAYNGRSGIEKALETVPDLIVSDVMMPEKDGFEVCDFLKNDERTSHIPIVLLTAKADVESRIKGLRRGADAYLAKPFHQEELLVTLNNLLELRKKLQAKFSALVFSSSSLDPHPSSLSSDPEDAFLQKLHTAVQVRIGDAGLKAEDVCRAVGMGRSNLYAKLSALTGMSFNIYLRSLRLHKARELLLTTDMNVSEVAYEVGFNDPKYFSRVFSEEFGTPPSELKR